ncbi:MAG TPA: hypothetical protein VND98_07540 [Solirubrobacterales bacterium]|nr:hypothetical protein [Solirubrobacterales bacterium]
MPFHVQLSSSLHRARVFNLEEDELRRTVLEPWVASQPFEFGERRWEPRESKLTVLEGRALTTPDLSFGQGWSNALRLAEDVTPRMVEAAQASAPPPGAALIEADSLDDALARLSAGDESQRIPWTVALERIEGRDPAVAALIVVLRRPERGPQRS